MFWQGMTQVVMSFRALALVLRLPALKQGMTQVGSVFRPLALDLRLPALKQGMAFASAHGRAHLQKVSSWRQKISIEMLV